MDKFKPFLIGALLSGVISVLGAPVFAEIWGPVNPASTVFALIAVAIRFLKSKNEKFIMFLMIIGGIFAIDFFMGRFYVGITPPNTGLILLIGSLFVLGLVAALIPLIGTIKREGRHHVIFACAVMAFGIYFYGIFYGGITPGVSDGPKLAAIISVIFLKLNREEELGILWNMLFIIGILGDFIIPIISLMGVIGETF